MNHDDDYNPLYHSALMPFCHYFRDESPITYMTAVAVCQLFQTRRMENQNLGFGVFYFPLKTLSVSNSLPTLNQNLSTDSSPDSSSLPYNENSNTSQNSFSPADVSPDDISSSTNSISSSLISITTTSSEIVHIPLNDQLFTYPYSETPILLLRSLIALQNRSNNLLVEFSTFGGEEQSSLRYVLCIVSINNGLFKLPKNSNLIFTWISNNWNDFEPKKLREKCGERFEKASLYDVYRQIPQYKEISPPSQPPSAVSSLHNQLQHQHTSTVLDLPKDMILLILSYLCSHSLATLACCNRTLKDITKLIIPGLELKLFPHQENSVLWMINQEAPLAPPLSPSSNLTVDEMFRESLFQRSFELNSSPSSSTSSSSSSSSSSELSLIYSLSLKQFTSTTSTSLERKYFYERAVRGGMLCDEPGLGKTITMLAIILKSIGAQTISMKKLELEEVHNSDQMMSLRSPTARKRSISHLSLLPSKTTVIIAPDSLLTHWRDQINLHVNPTMKLKVFVDSDLSYSLPPAEEICDYDIFITTFRRLSSEWRQGKPSCLLDEKKRLTFEEEFQGHVHVPTFLTPPKKGSSTTHQLSELLKIHWLRIVIDEGHQLGRSATTNAIQMASLLEAERRWILTGTPTRSFSSEVTTTALRHLYQMLKFVRYQPLMAPDSESLWKKYISRPLEQNIPSGLAPTQSGAYPLIQILSRIMIRHSKEGMPHIPKPIWKKTLLEMNTIEKTSYNAIVALAQSNLVTTGNDYLLPGGKHLDSLLNPRNRKFLTETLSNIRVACCGGGHAQLQLINFEFNRTECLDMMRANNPDISAAIIAKVNSFIYSTVDGRTSECDSCRLKLVVLLVAPCGHLYCPDCLQEMRDYCKLCDSNFNWNFLQRLQPGFEAKDYLFFLPPNLPAAPVGPEGVAPTTTTTAVPVNDEILFSESSTKARYLIEEIRKMEKEYLSRSEKYALYLKSHPHWSASIKKNIIVPKVIVFSQFFEFLDRMAIDFTLAKIKFVTFHGKNKVKELRRFQYVPDIRVLFLSKDGSHGLDLSYVTHIFLMDTILDSSLMQQVVSRAYRMGCKQSVLVNQLIMKGTIEESIYRFSRHLEGGQTIESEGLPVEESSEEKEADRSELTPQSGDRSSLPMMHFLVKSLKLQRE